MPNSSDASKTESRRRGRGRPARLSREQIAGAALEVGLDKATVTALAAHLGVDHSSLYRHVRNRDAIVALAAEMAIAELDWRSPTGADWRVELIKLTDAIWELYQRHPGLAEAFRTMEIMPQSGIRAFAEAVSRLQAHGFLLEDAVLAIDTLVDLVGDCFLGWHALGQADRQQGTRMEAMVAQWRREACALPDHAEQIGGMITVMQGGARPWWERKRDLVLDGLQQRYSPTTR
ncbi:TetR/AcrR family transcriptional regulator [Roseovarius pacificus]|nr:TetR/AcrR family transcriptional regulator C-terminal domain-containing protein [Roseovarius pacificus]